MNPILQHHLAPLAPFLADTAVREIVVNRPGEIGVEDQGGWRWIAEPQLTALWLSTLARAAAAHTGQDVASEAPICSTALPGGARCQIVLPPAASDISLTIRRPMDAAPSLADLAAAGLFHNTRREPAPSMPVIAASGGAGLMEFLADAVRARRTLLISGATGSGKTTLARALCAQIPADERLITIEDVRELEVPHRNVVRLTWAREGQGRAKLGPADLLAAALRMRPDRILLGEIRDGPSAYHLLRNVASGHPGSLATIHAGSCELALEQLALVVKETPAGRDLPRQDIRVLFEGLIDIVVQMERRGGRFEVTEVRHGDPRRPAMAA